MQPVQYFFGIIYAPTVPVENIKNIISDAFGVLDDYFEEFLFDKTSYYAPEMGENLKKAFFSLKNTKIPYKIAEFKESSIVLEREFFTEKGKRLVNIDPGYLDLTKIVLASTKYGGHKIALSNTMYADMVMEYYKGEFRGFDWTFPDFKSGMYDGYFKRLRELYRGKVKGEAFSSF
ncbi:DUF4416 family protein [bacterium]|nr:DUF4416 family protein [bacterium]